MKAMVITSPGGPEVLQVRTVEDPTYGPNDVLVRVHATALNRADLLQRRGRYPAPEGIPQDIPGLEMAGTIVEVGENVEPWTRGDPVFALMPGGAYAEFVSLPASMLLLMPPNLDFHQAASLPEVFITAYDALFNRLSLTPGESLLIHAVGSGVGTAAVQLAHAIGVVTLGTTSSAEKLQRASAIGLDKGINYLEEDFALAVAEFTQGRGVTCILDVIGANYFEQNIRSLAERGRMIVVGTMTGSKIDLDLGLLMAKRLQLGGTVLRARTLEEKTSLTQQIADDVVPLLEAGVITPTVDSVWPITEAGQAHVHMEANRNFGKIVLAVEF